jgi:CheY-like chemotaxis protein
VAISGSAALDAMDWDQMPSPDIIFADYHLDGETGFELIDRLRGMFGEAVPAILVTADRSLDVRQQAASLDIPILTKPVKPAALRSMLARHQRMTAAAE